MRPLHGPRPIGVNDGINIFTAQKATPSVYHVRTPQFLHLDGHHEPLQRGQRINIGSIFPSGRSPQSLADSHLGD